MKCDDSHAGKCQDCPLLCEQCATEYWPWFCSESKTRWVDREADIVEQDCNLISSDFEAIREAIAGEGRLITVPETVYRALMRGNGIGAARGEE